MVVMLWRFFCWLSCFLISSVPVVQSFAVVPSHASSSTSSVSSSTSRGCAVDRTIFNYSLITTTSTTWSTTSTRLQSSSPVEPLPTVLHEVEETNGSFSRLDALSSPPAATATDELAAVEPVVSVSTTTTTTSSSSSIGSTYVRCANCQTVYAVTAEDFGALGRRMECSMCGHAWYQSKDRVMTLNPKENILVDLSPRELDRLEMNRQEGKPLKFIGEKKLYIGNVAFEAHEEDFYQVFGQYGIVGDVSLVRDEAGKIKGFGFVTMRTAAGAAMALEKIDGLLVRGREVAVRESMTT